MKKAIEKILFGSRWILVLFYTGLIIALLTYAYTYFITVIHLIGDIGHIDSNGVMVIILELIDMVMIASLIKVIITGSYHAFISKDHDYGDDKASSGFLKIKISTSLIGVSAIHLLQSFMKIEIITWDTINKQLAIHGGFIIGAIALAFIEYLHDKTLIDHKEEKN